MNIKLLLADLKKAVRRKQKDPFKLCQLFFIPIFICISIIGRESERKRATWRKWEKEKRTGNNSWNKKGMEVMEKVCERNNICYLWNIVGELWLEI